MGRGSQPSHLGSHLVAMHGMGIDDHVHAALLPTLSHARAEREQLERSQGLLPESQGRNLALTVLHVPKSLDSACTLCMARASMTGHVGFDLSALDKFERTSSSLPYRGYSTIRSHTRRSTPSPCGAAARSG